MKQLATTSLSIATGLIALSASALTFAQSQSPQLMSGYAELNHELDTKSAMQGQIVSAKLTNSIQTADGLKLPSGTELLGHVDQVQASHKSGQSVIELTFDKAQLKDGKQVPVKATLIEVDPANSQSSVLPPVASDDKFQQESAVSGATLISSVQATDSGKLVRKDKNIRLETGTKLLIAVAPGSAIGGSASGS